MIPALKAHALMGLSGMIPEGFPEEVVFKQTLGVRQKKEEG